MVARLCPLWHKREEGLHCPYALQHLLPLHSVTFQPFLLVYKKELGLIIYVTQCVWVREPPQPHVLCCFCRAQSVTSLAGRCSRSCGERWAASNLRLLPSSMASHCTPAQTGGEKIERKQRNTELYTDL